MSYFCRFGDFVSDQVVAPVRETTAMVLGNLMKLMKPNQLVIVIEALLELTNVGEWECRHGAYLGLKYLLCAVNLDHDIIVQLIYPRVFNGLKDGVDDVVSEAAGALLPVVKQFIDRLVSSVFPFLNYEDTKQFSRMFLLQIYKSYCKKKKKNQTSI